MLPNRSLALTLELGRVSDPRHQPITVHPGLHDPWLGGYMGDHRHQGLAVEAQAQQVDLVRLEQADFVHSSERQHVAHQRTCS